MKRLKNSIILYEIIGFTAVICLLWVDEVLDLPHMLFFAKATPINWVESLMETIFVSALAIAIVTVTSRALKELKYLEGFLPVCSFCKKIRVDDTTWVPIETYITKHSSAVFSHSYCPDCINKFYNTDSESPQ